jgi:ankyrin repeat protein
VYDHPALALEAASAGDPNTLRAFLSQKPEAVDLVIQDRTALYNAASHNYIECVKVLLEYHATVNIQDSNGLTPLHWACHHGNTEVIKLLLKAGADPAKIDENGTNCLHKCIHKGCLK